MNQGIELPKMGQTMDEGTLVKWLKEVGDEVKKDDVIAEVETDKSTLEVDSPYEGYLINKVYGEGDVIPVSEIICYIGNSNEIGQEPEKQDQLKEDTTEDQKSEEEQEINTPVNNNQEQTESKRIRLSPAARKKARELGIEENDFKSINGSGPRGRIVLKDLENYSSEKAFQNINTDQVPVNQNKQIEESVSRIRSLTAQKLTKSFRDVPQFTIKKRVDLSKIYKLRTKLKAVGINVSINDFIIKAASEALEQNELVNAYFSEKDNQYKVLKNKEVNIGLAVAVDHGLVVPVIKNTTELTLAEIVKIRKTIISKAKDNKLTSEDMTGGTFTISNLGSFDVDEFTAIINTPESAILAVSSTKKQPVVTDDDQIGIKPIITLVASFDHRTLDGADAAKFMQDLSNKLETDDWKIV